MLNAIDLTSADPTVAHLIIIDADEPAGHEGHWPMLEHKGLNSELKLYYRLYAVNSVESIGDGDQHGQRDH